MTHKKWVLRNKKPNRLAPFGNTQGKSSGQDIKNKKYNLSEIVKVLLANRGLNTKKEIEDFLNPTLSDLTVEKVGISKKEIGRSVGRIKEAIERGEQIIVFGDYDVDGICGSAILWETLNALSAKVLPYIPHRIDEGYGLSKIGIENVLKKIPDTKVIITVDNGIVARKAVKFAIEKDIDVIITDHHVPASKKPKAFATVHTTRLCGAGVAYILSEKLKTQNSKVKSEGKFEHLNLVAIATVADLVPVVGPNRIFLKFGLKELRKTDRTGLKALIREVDLDQSEIGVFEIGHILGPRINAMGRLELAVDSLRLLCTKDKKSAEKLAKRLNATNKKRKEITIESFEHAKLTIQNSENKLQNLIFISHESYQPGVIGLIASRLVEEFYRPSIVLSLGEKFSKASARSVAGFNIIEFIRKASDLLVDAGGHPMAAGFTVETARIQELALKFEKLSKSMITGKMLERVLRIDTEILLEDINEQFYNEIQKLSPFGAGNPQPTFLSKNLVISTMRMVGFDNQHVLFRLVSPENKPIDAIGFNFSKRWNETRIGDRIDVVYTIDREIWQGNIKFKLKLKDFKK